MNFSIIISARGQFCYIDFLRPSFAELRMFIEQRLATPSTSSPALVSASAPSSSKAGANTPIYHESSIRPS